MRPLRALLPVAATFVLGLAGLLVPGPVGDIASYVWLGVFPGLALVRLLLPQAPPSTRWTLGLALSPLATAAAGWALLSAGQPVATAARVIAVGGWLLFAGGQARSLDEGPASAADAPAARPAWAWSLAAAAFVALVLGASEWLRVRSDTWVHVGIVWEILERGIPPQDPRFAGLTLNYVWFYNLFVALASSLRGEPQPFIVIAVANVTWMATVVWLTWQLAWTVWRERRAAAGALPALLLGLNAGALLLWPLWFLRALVGDVRGLDEVRRILAAAGWDRADVIHQLSAPFAHSTNSWDKFTVGTALGYTYVLMLAWLWACARWLEADDGPGAARGRWLLVVFATAAGMMFFHLVVGLSALPVGIAACGLGFLLRRGSGDRTGASRWLALGAATAAGFAAAIPYLLGIMRGWQPEHSGVRHQYLRPDWPMPWTLLTSCGVIAVLAWPRLRRAFGEGRPAPQWLVLWTACMTLFAVVVHLPEDNEVKFVWQVFAPLAVFAGPAFVGLLARWSTRWGRVPATVALAFLFLLPSALFLRGYLSDPRNRTAEETHFDAGDRALHAWIRDSTSTDAVFLDHHSRDLLLVEGRRRLWAGTPHTAERAAFPRDLLEHRRRVMADLYGPTADLAADAAALDSLAAPGYVLYRRSDFAGDEPWRRVEADSSRFRRAYDSDRFVVIRRVR